MGEQIQVDFLERIRDEIKFASVNDLVSQIARDILSAREFFLCLVLRPLGWPCWARQIAHSLSPMILPPVIGSKYRL